MRSHQLANVVLKPVDLAAHLHFHSLNKLLLLFDGLGVVFEQLLTLVQGSLQCCLVLLHFVKGLLKLFEHACVVVVQTGLGADQELVQTGHLLPEFGQACLSCLERIDAGLQRLLLENNFFVDPVELLLVELVSVHQRGVQLLHLLVQILEQLDLPAVAVLSDQDPVELPVLLAL